VYDSSLAADEVKCDRSGKPDDRWVFTEENPRRELQVAAALAAASRALKGCNDELAAKCLNTAVAILQANEKQNSAAKINVWAELFLATGDKKYRELLLSEKETLIKRPERYARVIGRLLPALHDKKLSSEIIPALTAMKQNIDRQAQETPFGVPYRPNIWGAGWNIQDFGVTQYFLHVGFPEIFPKEYMLNALNFVLGNHPGSNAASFASGVGANSLTVAYGANRADWSYIPGGVGSGTALIRPDFPELKVWPFFWQQTEYVMGGGASNFMFLVLAADKLLNE
jgi:endoglucanase